MASPGVGPLTARKLLAAFASPEAIFEAGETALKQTAGAEAARGLLSEPGRADALLDQTLAWLQTPAAPELRGANAQDTWRAVLTLADPLYPKGLLQTADPPPLLYVHASAGYWHAASPLLDAQAGAIAMVGSRNASAQGARNATAFAQALAEAGWPIVSGLALGIDAAAHEGALAAGAAGAGTVAVIGTGIDRTYPKANAQLARKILQNGAIVSEFALGTPVMAHHFPRRNRIIAGLSRGTVVVEAAIQSGSLITARLAAEMGKDVFAVPGSIHSAHSKGCHHLIKQGAKLIEAAADILGESGYGPRLHPVQSNAAILIANNPAFPADSAPKAIKNTPAQAVWAHLSHDPVTLDTLAQLSGLSPADLQAQLFELEMAALVERLPGNRYQRLG
jgi:DNA processing protein